MSFGEQAGLTAAGALFVLTAVGMLFTADIPPETDDLPAVYQLTP